MKIKTFLFGVLGACSFALAISFCTPQVQAAVPSGSVSGFEIGTATGALQSILVTTGSGWFYGVAITSGTANDFAVCFDSASISGFTNLTAGTTAAPPLAIITQSTTSTTQSSGPGQPTVGYSNGIVCTKSAANDRVFIYYKPVNQ